MRAAPATAPRSAPDLTLTLDPAVLWPDPEQCPDWPVYNNETSRLHNAPRSRQDAEDTLARLHRHLNRGVPVHAPTPAEAQAAQREHFRSGHPDNWRWHTLGVRDLTAANRTDTVADMIVEAAHIRGHLRKLDARAARAVQQKADWERQQLEATLADYARNSAGWAAEVASLAEAEARHKQRLDDERAAGRANELRSAIRHSHHEAAMAARKLGREAPTMPALN